jgi:hypothetical protein
MPICAYAHGSIFKDGESSLALQVAYYPLLFHFAQAPVSLASAPELLCAVTLRPISARVMAAASLLAWPATRGSWAVLLWLLPCTAFTRHLGRFQAYRVKL